MATGIKEIYSLILYYAFARCIYLSHRVMFSWLLLFAISLFSLLCYPYFSLFSVGAFLSMHRKFDRLFVYLRSFSMLLISLCCLRFHLCVWGDSKKKKQQAIYLLEYDSVSCIRNIEPKFLWSLCSMRRILKRQHLRFPLLTLLIQYRHKYRSDSVNSWLYEP